MTHAVRSRDEKKEELRKEIHWLLAPNGTSLRRRAHLRSSPFILQPPHMAAAVGFAHEVDRQIDTPRATAPRVAVTVRTTQVIDKASVGLYSFVHQPLKPRNLCSRTNTPRTQSAGERQDGSSAVVLTNDDSHPQSRPARVGRCLCACALQRRWAPPPPTPQLVHTPSSWRFRREEESMSSRPRVIRRHQRLSTRSSVPSLSSLALPRLAVRA